MNGSYNFKGIPLQNAFARIDTVSSFKNNCTISVNIYADKESFENDMDYLEQIYPIYFMKEIGDEVGDDRTQGYNYLLREHDIFDSWRAITS